jgi:large subunit ribosomal protein L17
MRHNKKVNHLGRQSGHRKALMSNMASSLILHKRIETTVAKAKALKKFAEPLITKSKEDTTHSRRVVFSYLKDKYAVTELFRVVAPAVGNRPGGYTRILHTGFRLGDAAEMCIIELVDFNESYNSGAAPEAKAKTRRSRSGARKADVASAVEAGEESIGEATDAPVVEKTEKKAPAKKAPAKAAAPKSAAKPSAKAAPKVSGAKAKATKTGISKKS